MLRLIPICTVDLAFGSTCILLMFAWHRRSAQYGSFDEQISLLKLAFEKGTAQAKPRKKILCAMYWWNISQLMNTSPTSSIYHGLSEVVGLGHSSTAEEHCN